MHFQRELEGNLPRGTVGSASSEVLKGGRGCVCSILSGSTTSVSAIFKSACVCADVQTWVLWSFSQFSAKLLCCCAALGLV